MATPTIGRLPPAPKRTDLPATFSQKADAFVAALQPYRDDLVAAIDWQNTTFINTETQANNAADSATLSSEWATKTGATVDGDYSSKEYATGTTVSVGSAKEWAQGTRAEGSAKEWATTTTEVSGGLKGAQGYAQDAQTSADASAASANFKGEWSSLTGSLAKPASVRHSNVLWILLSDLADVTLSEPGVSADWDYVYFPSFAGQAGNTLAVNATGNGLEWTPGLDVGKVVLSSWYDPRSSYLKLDNSTILKTDYPKFTDFVSTYFAYSYFVDSLSSYGGAENKISYNATHKYLLAGDNGNLQKMNEAQSKTTLTIPSGVYSPVVRYLNGNFVVAPRQIGEWLYKSSSATSNWEAISTPFDYVKDMAYGGGYYVVLGRDISTSIPRIFRSTDLISWTDVGASSYYEGFVSYSPALNKFAIGYTSSDSIKLSTDATATTWNSYATGVSPGVGALKWVDDKFVAACSYSPSHTTGYAFIATSSDGQSWTTRVGSTSETDFGLSTISSSGAGNIVILGREGTYYTTFYVSNDSGTSFSKDRDSNSNIIIPYDSTYADGKMWYATNRGVFYQPYSTGTFLQMASTSITSPSNYIDSGDGYVLADRNGLFKTVSSSTSFSVDYMFNASSSYNDLYGAEYTSGGDVIVGVNNSNADRSIIKYSTSSQVWKAYGITDNIKASASDGTTIIFLAGYTDLLVTTDYDTFTRITPTTNGNIQNVRYVNGKFFIVGSEGTISSSTDGVTWTQHTFPTSATLYDITYFNTNYVVTGGYKSSDLSTWTAPVNMETPPLYIGYDANYYIGVTSNGYFVISEDGSNWAKTATSPVGTVKDIVVGHDAVYTAGSSPQRYVIDNNNLRLTPVQAFDNHFSYVRVE